MGAGVGKSGEIEGDSVVSKTLPEKLAQARARGGKAAPAPKPAPANKNLEGLNMVTRQIQGDIDTTYYTQQRDIFTSGLAAEIGIAAFAVWHAIKWHADFNTGESYPGIRRIAEITGTAPSTVQIAIKVLVDKHLLRIRKAGRKNVYVARERIDVRVGGRVITTIVVDFIPDQMRERLAKLKAAGAGDIDAADVWAQVDLLPGPGMVLDKKTGTFSGSMRADEVPAQMPSHQTQSVSDAKSALKQIADQLRVSLKN